MALFTSTLGFLALKKEFASATDSKAVVRRFGEAADLERISVDYVFVSVGVSRVIINVPAEGFDERVQELTAKLGFVVPTGIIVLQMVREDVYWATNGIRRCHMNPSYRINGVRPELFLNSPTIAIL